MTLNFGKYKGVNIKDVPASYLYWCISNISWFGDSLKKEESHIFTALKETAEALNEERDAWAYTGGRLPTFDDIFYKVLKAKTGKKSEVKG